MNQTIFLDIDGTICRHQDYLEKMLELPMEILPGVREQIDRWHYDNDLIVLTTARPEWSKERTKQQLKEARVYYDRIFYDMTAGVRILVNDEKTHTKETAKAIVVPRNYGLWELNQTAAEEFELLNYLLEFGDGPQEIIAYALWAHITGFPNWWTKNRTVDTQYLLEKVKECNGWFHYVTKSTARYPLLNPNSGPRYEFLPMPLWLEDYAKNNHKLDFV